MSNSITAQMSEILNEVSVTANKAIEKAVDSIPKKAGKKLRAVSPKNRGKYAKGWTSKKLSEKSAVVYNSTEPGLTHLLENGHVIKNQYGEFGRYNGEKHIKQVADEYAKEFIDEVENAIE